MKTMNNIHPLRTAPPRADRKHPERDTATRWRAVPADSVSKQGSMILVPRHFMLGVDGKPLQGGDIGPLVASLSARIGLLEKQVQLLRRGEGAPLEPDRPMTPVSKEQSMAHIAVSVPGNEAEVLNTLDVTPAAKAETVLLLPAPSKLSVVPDLQTPAANEEIVIAPNVTLLPAAKPSVVEVVDDYTDWLSKQFGWAPTEMFVILDREFQRRNKSALKIHKMTYNDIRLKRAIAKRGMVVPGMHAFFMAEGNGYVEWEASRTGMPTQLSVRAFLQKYERDAYRAYKRGMAFTPEAYKVRQQRVNARRKQDILGRLDGAKFGYAVKFAMVDAKAHDPVVKRTSADQIKGFGLMFHDMADRVRRAVGMGIRSDHNADLIREQASDEGAHYQAFKEFFTERITPSDGGPDIPHPSDHWTQEAIALTHDLAQLPMRELVRRYQHHGISH
jgi:hypothetical protein